MMAHVPVCRGGPENFGEATPFWVAGEASGIEGMNAREGPSPGKETRARPGTSYETSGRRRILRLREMWRIFENPLTTPLGEQRSALGIKGFSG
jgi:hypothetical protein